MEAAEGVQFDLYLNALRTFFWAFQFQSRDDFPLFVITHARGRLKVKPLRLVQAYGLKKRRGPPRDRAKNQRRPISAFADIPFFQTAS
jgi:hypothetical protein